MAVSNRTGLVSYESDCNGCNGGITLDQTRKIMSVPSVQLYPYLKVEKSEDSQNSKNINISETLQ